MGIVVGSNPQKSVNSPQLENSRKCQEYLRITSYVVALILLIVGVLAVAKVSPFNSIGNTWGGIMIGCAVITPGLIERCERCERCTIGKGQKCPVPTYDEMIANDSKLAKLVHPADNVDVKVVYHLSSENDSNTSSTKTYSKMDLEGRRLVIEKIRDLFANGSYQSYRVNVIFEKSPTEKCEFNWSFP